MDFDGELRRIFAGAADFQARDLEVSGCRLTLYMIDGLVSGAQVAETVLRPLNCLRGDMGELYAQALGGGVYNAGARVVSDAAQGAELLSAGYCLVLFPGAGCMAFEAKTGEKRAPSGPEVENTIKGPRDCFTESLRTNTSLLRRHLRTPALGLYETTVGRRSLTAVTLLYIEGLTNPALVSRMQARLGEIDIDGLLSPAAAEEYLTGSRRTAFPLLQYTERADRLAQGLLDGRVGVLIDGLPLAYLAPVDLGYLMTGPEDRGMDYISASFVRILRYCALFLALLLPGFYVAMAMYHQEMIPLPLLRSIIESKQAVPFPTAAEVAGLLLAFELLQEAGIHLPQSIGQTVSIIGGLVVGTAAVEARLISPAALIAVSVSGICGFALPGRDFGDAVRLWRLGLTLAAALGGLFGLTAGFLALVLHLAGLESLGLPYLTDWPGILRPRLVMQKHRDPNLHPLDMRNQR